MDRQISKRVGRTNCRFVPNPVSITNHAPIEPSCGRGLFQNHYTYLYLSWNSFKPNLGIDQLFEITTGLKTKKVTSHVRMSQNTKNSRDHRPTLKRAQAARVIGRGIADMIFPEMIVVESTSQWSGWGLFALCTRSPYILTYTRL